MGYAEEMAKRDQERHAAEREFSIDNQPKVPMPILTRCERVQPTCAGLNRRGEMIWKGLEMARWQMEMLRRRYAGDFRAFWDKLNLLETFGFESHNDIPNMQMTTHRDDERFDCITKRNRERRNTGD